MPRHLHRGRADVEHDGLSLLDEAGRGRADPLLGLGSLDRDLRERAIFLGADGAAVDPLELSLAGEHAQIPSDGHGRHLEGGSQLGHAGRARPHQPQDALPSLCR